LAIYIKPTLVMNSYLCLKGGKIPDDNMSSCICVWVCRVPISMSEFLGSGGSRPMVAGLLESWRQGDRCSAMHSRRVCGSVQL